MALVTDRVGGANRDDGSYAITVTYESTGQNLVDYFSVHNDCPEPVRIIVRDAAGSLLHDEWYGGGPAKNPAPHPNGPDTDVPAPAGLSWRRATKQTNFGLGFAYPSYPPEGAP